MFSFHSLIPVEITVCDVKEERLERVASADSLALGKVFLLLQPSLLTRTLPLKISFLFLPYRM